MKHRVLTIVVVIVSEARAPREAFSLYFVFQDRRAKSIAISYTKIQYICKPTRYDYVDEYIENSDEELDRVEGKIEDSDEEPDVVEEHREVSNQEKNYVFQAIAKHLYAAKQTEKIEISLQ